ncbi:MAG TPA: CHAD domain-containing protein [Rhizomicrobium sp.]|jgi:CHAD domain-containing protein
MEDPRVAVHSLVRRNLGPARPVKAGPAAIASSMRPEEAFRATLSDCLTQIAANAATVRAGRSVEGLHQLRVAFRRLEVALGAFGREFRQDWLEELRSRAKILQGRLSPARDLDVFVGKLLNEAPGAGSAEGFPALRACAETARDAAWDAVGVCIASTDFELFTGDIAALAQSQLPLTRRRRLPKTAARMLDQQVRRVKKRGKVATGGEEADMHRLRIALKKLRYSAEFLAPLYRARDVKRYLKKLRGLQNRLGDLNDIANVRGVVTNLLRDDRKNDGDTAMGFAAGSVTGWYGAQTPIAIKLALKRYRKFRKITPFWR